MTKERLKEALGIAEATGFIIIATADKTGKPHIASAGKMEITGETEVAVLEWFCPGTIQNLGANKKLSLVVWDRREDKGYQLTGEFKRMENIAMMDGYSVETEHKEILPQVERKIFVKINSIIEFKQAPHSDMEK